MEHRFANRLRLNLPVLTSPLVVDDKRFFTKINCVRRVRPGMTLGELFLAAVTAFVMLFLAIRWLLNIVSEQGSAKTLVDT